MRQHFDTYHEMIPIYNSVQLYALTYNTDVYHSFTRKIKERTTIIVFLHYMHNETGKILSSHITSPEVEFSSLMQTRKVE